MTVIAGVLTASVLVCALVAVVLGLQLDTAVQRRPPGLNSTAKVWWAKEITPDFHMAGRLTERQIKYAAEGGFRSIVSLFIYEEDDSGSFGGKYLPTTAEAWAAAHIAGLQYVALLGPQDDWASVEAVQKLTDILKNLRRPVLLHCDRAYTITFVTLMHMANETRYKPEYEPKIYSDDFYRITAAMGLDFTHDDTRRVVANITGEDEVMNPIKHNCEPEEWLDFWLAHPIYNNWYSSGQIRTCDVKALEQIGFKVVVNMRLGNSYKGKPSQEPVTLLNINDETDTYGNQSQLPRQDLKMLEKSKIHMHMSTEYIGEKSKRNFEDENPQEFGDDIGYNEQLERHIVEKSSLKYYHLPLPMVSNYSKEDFDQVRDILLEAGQQGPVLLHCGDGRRVVYFGVLAAAIQQGKDLQWALKRTRELGFEVSANSRPDIYKIYCSSLQTSGGVSSGVKEEL